MAGEIFNGDTARPTKVAYSLDRSEADNPDDYFKPNTTEIVEPVRQLIAQFKGYQFLFHGTQGESHVTSWFVALPKSLRHVFGDVKKERTGEAK